MTNKLVFEAVRKERDLMEKGIREVVESELENKEQFKKYLDNKMAEIHDITEDMISHYETQNREFSLDEFEIAERLKPQIMGLEPCAKTKLIQFIMRFQILITPKTILSFFQGPDPHFMEFANDLFTLIDDFGSNLEIKDPDLTIRI